MNKEISYAFHKKQELKKDENCKLLKTPLLALHIRLKI